MLATWTRRRGEVSAPSFVSWRAANAPDLLGEGSLARPMTLRYGIGLWPGLLSSSLLSWQVLLAVFHKKKKGNQPSCAMQASRRLALMKCCFKALKNCS